MITYTVEIDVTFKPKLWVLKWPKVEKARMRLAIWLIWLGLREPCREPPRQLSL